MFLRRVWDAIRPFVLSYPKDIMLIAIINILALGAYIQYRKPSSPFVVAVGWALGFTIGTWILSLL